MSTVKLEIYREHPGLCPSLIGRWQDFKILNPGKGHDINMLLQAKGKGGVAMGLQKPRRTALCNEMRTEISY